MKIFLLIAIIVFHSFCAQSQTLPAFSFTNAKKEKITAASLPQNKPSIIFYFDPFSDKCEEQATKIKGSAAKFADIVIVVVSSASAEDNEAFRKKNLVGLKNLFVCTDTEFRFDTWFGYSETPSIYVYNKARDRTAAFTKVVSVEEILDACTKTR
jgi:peroxiredoxin